MQSHPYFQILGKLTKERVHYCVVGLLGASFYGSTLSTYDLDVLVEPTKKTLSKVRSLLRKYGLSEVVVYQEKVLKPLPNDEQILKKRMTILFVDPYGLSIDVMTQISGFNFVTVWKGRRKFLIQGQKIYVASLRHILLSKLKSGRQKDLLQVRQLKDLLKSLPKVR